MMPGPGVGRAIATEMDLRSTSGAVNQLNFPDPAELSGINDSTEAPGGNRVKQRIDSIRRLGPR